MSLSPMWNFCHLKDAGAYVQGCVDGRRSTVCLPPGRVALCLSIPHNTTRAPGQASLQANRGHRHHSNSQPSHSREAHHHPLETSTSNIHHALYAPTCPYMSQYASVTLVFISHQVFTLELSCCALSALIVWQANASWLSDWSVLMAKHIWGHLCVHYKPGPHRVCLCPLAGRWAPVGTFWWVQYWAGG